MQINWVIGNMTKKKPAGEKKKMGRPTKYNPTKHNKQAHELAELGATNDQIAEALHISPDTLNQWRIRYPDFSESIKTGKDKTDDEVELSLLSRAKGMKVKKVRIIQIGDERLEVDGDGREWRVTAKRKEMSEDEIPPDTAAAFIWLKNRRPAHWKDKQVQEITGKDGASIEITAIPDERLAELLLKK